MGKKKKKKNKKNKGADAEPEVPGEEAKKEEGAAPVEGAPPPAEGGGEVKEEGEAEASAEKKEEDAGSDTGKHKSEKTGNTSGRVPPLHNYTLDLTCLTAAEETTIKGVLEKDEMETAPVRDHVQTLKNELDIIHRGFRKRPGDPPTCINCRKKFGIWRYLFPVLYLGKRCQRCRHKACKRCIHKMANGLNMCGMCVRLREIKLLTGEWMVPPATRLHSSDLLRVSFRDKEKYQMLHASREKKKQELLTKLNALHGKGGADNNLSMWSTAPKKKDKKDKKDKKKKDKKKKKKKDKAGNNAIMSPASGDMNASFLEAIRIAESLELEEESKARASSSSSSSTVDSSSDSEVSVANGPGGGFSSGYESCEQHRGVTQGQGRGERSPDADPTREDKKTDGKPSRSGGDYDTLRDVAEARQDFPYGNDDHYNQRGEDLNGKLAKNYYGDAKVSQKGFYSLKEGRWVGDEDDNLNKAGEIARERKPRRVKYEDLEINNGQRTSSQKSIKGNLKRNAIADNLVFDDGAEDAWGNLSLPRPDQDTEANDERHHTRDTTPRGRGRKQSKVRTFSLRSPQSQNNENRYEQRRRRKSVEERSYGICPSSSYAFANETSQAQFESIRLGEDGDDWASLKPTRRDRSRTSSKTRTRSTSGVGVMGYTRASDEEERVKRKDAVKKKLSQHTYIVTSAQKSHSTDGEFDLLRCKEQKRFSDVDGKSRSGESGEEMVSPKHDRYHSLKTGGHKNTKKNPSERHGRNRHAGLHSPPYSHQLQTQLGRNGQERPVNETPFTTARKSSRDKSKPDHLPGSSHRDLPQRQDTRCKLDQKLAVPYLELFDMAELNTDGKKSDFILSEANLALHNAAAAVGTRPRAFCLSQPDCARLNRNWRDGRSGAASGAVNIVNQEGEKRPKNSSPSKNYTQTGCKASGVRFSSGQSSKSPKASLGDRLRKTLGNVLDIPDY